MTDFIPDRTAARRKWRREFIDQFLAEINITHDMLSPSTQTSLNEWARQVQLVTDQPSANWDQAVLQLSKAVESELACKLGQVKGLECLASEKPLGDKAKDLEDIQKRALTRRLSLLKFTVPPELPGLLFNLAKLRNPAAHGGVAVRTATRTEGQRARNITAKILKRIIQADKGKP
jgi:hypothetical protein